jgi:hypothetical protein
VRRAACERVVAAAVTLETTDDSATIALPEIEGSAGIQKGTAFALGHSHVGLNTSAELTKRMEDVAGEVRCKQAAKGGAGTTGRWP